MKITYRINFTPAAAIALEGVPIEFLTPPDEAGCIHPQRGDLLRVRLGGEERSCEVVQREIIHISASEMDLMLTLGSPLF